MFTGIIEELGRITNASMHGLRLEGDLVMDGLILGDSISVNGACLTVTSIQDSNFTVDLSPETIKRTNLGKLSTRDPVNLERPTAVNGRLGGHIVQGHVDDTATLKAKQAEGNSMVMKFEAPDDIMKYIVEKGFIAIDGISLTVISRDASAFSISVIPFTLAHTNLGYRQSEDQVNIEVDIVAKYVDQLVGSYVGKS